MNKTHTLINNLLESVKDDVYCNLLDHGLTPAEAYKLAFYGETSFEDVAQDDYDWDNDPQYEDEDAIYGQFELA